MAGSYTLQIEAFGVYASNMPSLEIWEDGVLHSTHAISSSGTSFSVNINYGGSLPTSLAFTFNDGFAANGRTIEIRSVRVDNQYVSVGNYLSTDSLTKNATATVDVAASVFLFDANDPALSEFTTGATRTMTAGNDSLRDFGGTTDEIFDALGGRDVLYLGSGDDKVFGNTGDDIIYAGAGNDLISGGDDNDKIYGGTGNDRLYGGNGDDRIHGEDGDDEIYGGAGNDTLNGHAGADIIVGGAGADKINGGDGDDIMYGGADDDQIVGGNGNDTIDGGDGDDVAYGGDGIDHIDGGAGNDWLIGNGGNDVISGGAGNDTILGLADDDELYGGAGNDYILGGTGNDFLSGDAGDDILEGGAGIDTASYTSASSAVTANLGVENHALDFAGGDDSVHLTGLALNTASGSRVTVEFWMEWDGVNNMMPFGFNGYDLWLQGGGFGFNNGASLVYGISSAGLANTPVHVAAVFVDSNTLSSKLYINGVEQTLTVRGGSVSNAAAQITSTARISGWGSNNSYKFDGTLDDLRIWNDERTAAEINQYMNYSITTPQADLEANYNFESIAAGAGGVLDSSGNANHGTLSGMTTGNQITWNNSGVSNGYASGGGDDDILSNIENLTGSSYDDVLDGDINANTINGGAGNDTIRGEGGNDILNGGEGNDILTGGTGNNTINGGAGSDTVIFAGDWSDYTVTLSGAIYTFVHASGTSTATLIEDFEFADGILTTADILTGAVPLNNITGTSGNDVIYSDSVAAGYNQFILDALTNNPTPVSGGSAVQGLVYNPDTGNFYQFVNVYISEGAMNTAISNGLVDGVAGSLAIFETTAERDWVIDNLGADYGSGAVYQNPSIVGDVNLGDSLLTTLSTAGAYGTSSGYRPYIVEWSGDAVLGAINNTGGAGVTAYLYGGDGEDDLYGAGGIDVFVFENASAFNDTDRIFDFSKTQGDKIDLSDILSDQGITVNAGNINNYIQVDQYNGLKVDITGLGQFWQAGKTIGSFNGDIDVQNALTMFNDGNLIV